MVPLVASIHLWLWGPQAGGAFSNYCFPSARLACYNRDYLHSSCPFSLIGSAAHLKIQPTAGKKKNKLCFPSPHGGARSTNICRQGNNTRHHGHKSGELVWDVHIWLRVHVDVEGWWWCWGTGCRMELLLRCAVHHSGLLVLLVPNSVERCHGAPMWSQHGQWNWESGHCGWQEAHSHSWIINLILKLKL